MICVVTSTHFSIGAGERSDAPRLFRRPLGMGGDREEGVREGAEEAEGDRVPALKAPSEPRRKRLFLLH